MKVIYLDCSMGAAGDMLAGALLDLLDDPQSFINRLNSLAIPGVMFSSNKVNKCGIEALKFNVEVEEDHHHGDHGHHHEHRGLREIEEFIDSLVELEEKVRNDAKSVYKIIAEAESHVHGCTVEDIHFHEVGTWDAVADVVSVSLILCELGAEKIIASPICVGSGTVKCMHGILPVPAPATAHILRGLPIYAGDIKTELCTPTGAALLRYFTSEFVSMPLMNVERIGYGAGSKELIQANCLRSFYGTFTESAEDEFKDEVVELVCNIDDMTGEELGAALRRIEELEPLDLFTEAINMKKSRPGVLLEVICRAVDVDKFVKAIFKHTSTIGIRERKCQRYTFERELECLRLPVGEVYLKRSKGYGVERYKYESDDIERVSRSSDLSFAEARNLVERLDHSI